METPYISTTPKPAGPSATSTVPVSAPIGGAHAVSEDTTTDAKPKQS